MKKNLKFLTVGLTALAASAAPMSILSSCKGKSIDDIANTLKASVLEEFKWICTHYRPTFNNEWFCEQVARKLTKWGYEPIYDRSTYTPIEEHKNEPYGFNMYFDIPATDDGKDIPNIILQAHTDMVTKSVSDYDWSKGVIPVIDEDGIMHSKDYQTSLGADDGIGVATILAIAKNPKAFKHGQIRCLLTVDEEDGDSGAASLVANWLDGYNYFLNLDGEHIKLTGCGCGGCQQAVWQTYNHQFASAEPRQHIYKIDIEGLKGGHSAHYIHEKRANAIVLMFYVIWLLDSSKADAKIQLIAAHDDNATEQARGTTGGTIPSQVHFVIGSNAELTETQVKQLVIQGLAGTVEDTQTVLSKTKFTEVTEEAEKTKYGNGITNEATLKLATLITDNTTERRLYGVIKESKDPKHPERPVQSCNIGAFRMGQDAYPFIEKAQNQDFYLELFGRTSDPAILGPRPKPSIAHDPNSFIGRFDKCVEAAFGLQPGPEGFFWSSTGYNYPWPEDIGNPLNLLIHEAADKNGYEMHDDVRTGWLEVGAIIALKPKMRIATLGPEVNDVHSPKEHVDTNTLVPMFKMMMYVLMNLKD